MAQRVNRKLIGFLVIFACVGLWWTRSTSSSSSFSSTSSSTFQNIRGGAGRYGSSGRSSSSSSSSSSSPRIAMITMNNKESSYDIMSMANKAGYCKKHGYDFRIDFEGKGFWHKFNMIEEAISTDQYDWIWWLDFDTLITNTTVTIEEIIDEAMRDSGRDPKDIDMIFTPDCWPLNAGSMLFRTTPTIPTLLSLARHCGKTNENLSEQDCLRDIIGVNPDNANHPSKSPYWSTRAIFVPQKRMNAFPEEIKCHEAEKTKSLPMDNNKGGRGGGKKKDGKKDQKEDQEVVVIKGGKWEPGDFLIHFAGAWAHVERENPTGWLMEKYKVFVDDVSGQGIGWNGN